MLTNKYSQNGEELIVANLLPLIDERVPNGIFIEFGGSKGTDNSNLFVFGEKGRQLILIEANARRFNLLSKIIGNQESIYGIQAKVGHKNGTNGERDTTLANILRENKVLSTQVSAVSIDIDGDDAAVFENLGLIPELAIVEFNPTLPVDSFFRNPPGEAIGNSPGELIRVARNLGMFVVGVTPTNLIFMKDYYRDKVKEADVTYEIQRHSLPRFGLGYDGTLIRFLSSGTNATSEVYHNGWNDSFVRQPLPRFMRTYTKKGKFVRISYFVITGLILQPLVTLKFILKLNGKMRKICGR